MAEIERSALKAAQEKARSEVEATYQRHMKALRMVFAKGVGALNAMVIDSPADAMRAIQLAIREERVALGEPTDRTAVSIEDTITREYARWMIVEDEESDPPDDRDADGGDADDVGRPRPGGAT